MYTNADGLINKRGDLKLLLGSFKIRPDIIAINEIKAKNTKGVVVPSEFYLDGFQCFCNGLECSAERGMLFLVNNSLSVSLVEVPSVFKECMFIVVNDGQSNKLLIGNIYRSPSSSLENDQTLLGLIKYLSNSLNLPTILVGDFNFPGIRWDIDTAGLVGLTCGERAFTDVLNENFFQQLVDRPTRQRGKDTPHILDLVITNEHIVKDIEYLSPLGHSDHSILNISCAIGYQPRCTPARFQFHKGNYLGLVNYLSRDWEREFHLISGNASDMWTSFRNILSKGVTIFIPKIQFSDVRKKNYFFR